MPAAGYLFIFLLVATLIFVYFYATRAKERGRVKMSKVARPDAGSDTAAQQ